MEERIFKEMLEEIYLLIRKYEKKLKGYYPYENLRSNVEFTLKSLSS